MFAPNSILPFFPEFVSAIITIAATIVTFRIAAKLGIIFRKGFITTGVGMTFLSISTVASSLSYFPTIDGPILDFVFDASIFFTSLFILRGVLLIYREIVGNQKEKSNQ